MADYNVSFGAKDAGLVAKVKDVKSNLEGLGGAIKKLIVPIAALGASFLAIRKISADFQKAIDMGGRLNDLAARTGETAGNLMILERAFQNAGVGADAVGATINRMQRFMVEASQRGGEQEKTMQRLGLSYEALKRLSPTEQLQEIAKRIAVINNPAERSAAAMQILGRSGGELIPLFRAMGIEIKNAQEQLGSAPRIMDQTNPLLDELGDNMKAIKEKSSEFALGLISQLLPGLVSLSKRLATIDAAGLGEKFSKYAKSVLQWASETFKLAGAFERLDTAFKSILQGDIGGGLKLMFLTARDTALNAINEIFARAKAAIDTLQDLFAILFRPGSPAMKAIEAGLFILKNKISQMISEAILAAIPKIKIFEGMLEEAKANVQALKNVEFHNMKVAGEIFSDAMEEAKLVAGEIPNIFSKNLAQNLRTPLFEMESRVKQTADHAAKLKENLQDAAKVTGDVQGPPLPPKIDELAPIVMQFKKTGGVNPNKALDNLLKETRQEPMTAREQFRVRNLLSRAQREESRGRFDASERLQKMAEQRVAQMRQRAQSASATEAAKGKESLKDVVNPLNRIFKLNESINKLMERLEPKLPTPALS